ncbi:hypothetical protein L209DRAFT_570395 [Thermothelomyces heterothallicus CBS 203.75]
MPTLALAGSRPCSDTSPFPAGSRPRAPTALVGREDVVVTEKCGPLELARVLAPAPDRRPVDPARVVLVHVRRLILRAAGAFVGGSADEATVRYRRQLRQGVNRQQLDQ